MDFTNLYRWEDSPGLGHCCWYCDTNQNDPKARRSCYGTHTEPCSAYHQTLFPVGSSHTCRACISGEAAHHERHLAIAKLVNEVLSYATEQETPNRSHRTARDGPEIGAMLEQEDPVGDLVPEIKTSAEQKSMTRSEKRAAKRMKKDKASQEKAVKNQQRFVLVVSQSDVDRVARAIHGMEYNVDKIGGHPGIGETDVADAVRRHDVHNAALEEHRTWLRGRVRMRKSRNGKKDAKAQEIHHETEIPSELLPQHQDTEDLVTAVLLELGISVGGEGSSTMAFHDHMTSSRSRKHTAALVTQLRAKITLDIEKSDNDCKATQKRMSGYWRYVNGTVTKRLAHNAQSVDRVTGARLRGGDNEQGNLEVEPEAGQEAEPDAEHARADNE